MKKYTEIDHDYLEIINKDIERRSDIYSPFAYYINNCTSVVGCPKRLGSFVCDVVYINEKLNGGRYELDIIGRYVNEIFYNRCLGEKDERKICKYILEGLGFKMGDNFIEKYCHHA